MRVVWVVVAAGVVVGHADPRAELARPRAAVEALGEVQNGIFSADGKAFLGWVAPVGKDPADVRLRPRPWTLWSVADGTPVATWAGDPIGGFDTPGSSDGTVWSAFLTEDPKAGNRCRLLDLTTGKTTDVPGVPGPTDTCSRPSFSADRTRLAYSDYGTARTGRVYEKRAGGWAEVAAVPGENAALSPDGKLVATVAWADGGRGEGRKTLAVRVFAVADGKQRWAAAVDSYGLVGFTPDGRYVIQSDNAGHRLLDAATGTQAALVANGPRGDAQGPREVAYRAGWVAAVVRGESKVELVRWDLAAGKEASRTAVESPFGRNRTPPFGSPRLAVVRAVEDHPVPERRNTFWSSMTVDVYDPAAAEPVTRVRLASAHSVIASPDGETLAAPGSRMLMFYPLPANK